jgi:hypothetical protein
VRRAPPHRRRQALGRATLTFVLDDAFSELGAHRI